MRTLEERFWRKVEKGDIDECWEWKGANNGKGYGQIGYNGKVKRAHRISYEINIGEIPEGMQIDHICGNRSCVNPHHLRIATPTQNNINRKNKNSNKLKGCYFSNRRKKWCACIGKDNRMIIIGYFKTEIEAHNAYCDTALSMYGEFANFG